MVSHIIPAHGDNPTMKLRFSSHSLFDFPLKGKQKRYFLCFPSSAGCGRDSISAAASSSSFISASFRHPPLFVVARRKTVRLTQGTHEMKKRKIYFFLNRFRETEARGRETIVAYDSSSVEPPFNYAPPLLTVGGGGEFSRKKKEGTEIF